MNTPVIIFTDGASRGNPGPGGWGAVIRYGVKVKECGGRNKSTTNNRMELTAVIEALRFLKTKKIQEKILLYTDSSYVLSGATKWLWGWKKNNWQTSTHTEVLNRDLWEAIESVMQGLSISFHLVKGHAGTPANERCDMIATAYADEKEIGLFDGLYDDYTVSLDVVSPKKKRISLIK